MGEFTIIESGAEQGRRLILWTKFLFWENAFLDSPKIARLKGKRSNKTLKRTNRCAQLLKIMGLCMTSSICSSVSAEMHSPYAKHS